MILPYVVDGKCRRLITGCASRKNFLLWETLTSHINTTMVMINIALPPTLQAAFSYCEYF